MRGRFVYRQFGLFLLLPTVIIVGFVFAYSIVTNVGLGFTSKTLISPGEYVGLQNYFDLIIDVRFWNSLLRNLIWTLGSVILQFLVGLGAALILFQNIKLRYFFRTILLLPWMMPIVVLAIIWIWMLSPLFGIIPFYLNYLGLTADMPGYLDSEHTALYTVIFIDVWRAYPLMMLAIFGALQSIPGEQFEAAKIEGASSLQTFRYITLPNIFQVAGILITLRIIWTFNTFDRIFLLTGGGPGTSTETLPIYIYKKTWSEMQLSKGASSSVVTLGIVAIFVIIYFKFFGILGGGRREIY